MSERRARTTAEWWSFIVAVGVLAVVVAGLLVRVSADEPARPVVGAPVVEPDGDRFAVSVDISNDGDRAAAEVQVQATLVVDGEESMGDQTVDFLGAGESTTLVFVFTDDPSTGELEVLVTSFADP